MASGKEKNPNSKTGQKKKTNSKQVINNKTQKKKNNSNHSSSKKDNHQKKVEKKNEEKSNAKVVKANTTKKVITKQQIKPIPAEEKVILPKKEVVSKNTKQKESHEHFSIYLFLLSTVLICLHVMSRFSIDMGDVTLSYAVILFSTVYFITNVITKKFDFKKAITAIVVSSFFMMIFIWFSQYFNAKVVDFYVIFGQLFAYVISQLLNLIVYYYLLVNTILKARWIYMSYMFALSAYYFIFILFANRVVMTDIFWPTFFCSILLSGILAIMYAFYDSLIKRGVE